MLYIKIDGCFVPPTPIGRIDFSFSLLEPIPNNSGESTIKSLSVNPVDLVVEETSLRLMLL